LTDAYWTRTVAISAGPNKGRKVILVYLAPSQKKYLDDCPSRVKFWNPMHGESQNHRAAVDLLIRELHEGQITGKVTGGDRRKGHRLYLHEYDKH
jgi:hypothetical protein